MQNDQAVADQGRQHPVSYETALVINFNKFLYTQL